jgi:hypothetical protein
MPFCDGYAPLAVNEDVDAAPGEWARKENCGIDGEWP